MANAYRNTTVNIILRIFDQGQPAYDLLPFHLNYHNNVSHTRAKLVLYTTSKGTVLVKKIWRHELPPLWLRGQIYCTCCLRRNRTGRQFRAGHNKCLQSAVSCTLQHITGTNGSRLPRGLHCVINQFILQSFRVYRTARNSRKTERYVLGSVRKQRHI